ncbi:hypothetical protein RYX56_18825 [Alkalihalophilus lindianensis]|uniref:Uncharacterized protein n=1 Tax=Alkalihalophilus lindianensis TaxID=1630542 RepID=A0ABU3XEV7_9BACI|nr:hypothetical protein [Alkalihalophilus lindianensis]MDV2686427.1 hypothetical protein [Alkalihalophilus lindianensis]
MTTNMDHYIEVVNSIIGNVNLKGLENPQTIFELNDKLVSAFAKIYGKRDVSFQ